MQQLVIKTDFERISAWRQAADAIFNDWDILFWPEDIKNISEKCRYAVVWAPDAALFEAMPQLEVVFSLGAGVDHIDFESMPAHLPIVRMVDRELTQGMQDFVLACVLDFSRYRYIYRQHQQQKLWQPLMQKSNNEWNILVLGMGELGTACAKILKELGFNVSGFARSQREVDGIKVIDEKELAQYLSKSDMVINVMPLTTKTDSFFDATRFAQFKQGAAFINVARGAQVDEMALRCALDNRIERCYLDVFVEEPLAEDAWQWEHPRIDVTPHIASMTYPNTALQYIYQQIGRHQRGEKLLNLVNREEGY